MRASCPAPGRSLSHGGATSPPRRRMQRSETEAGVGAPYRNASARSRRLSGLEPPAGSAMNFTDLFINKPVLAIVVSLLILVLGLRAVTSLTVRQYPETENATVTVTTAYYGADAQTVAGFITQPLEQAIAQAQGIDYLSSTSVCGRVDHHRHPAPQLRRQPRADRDQHPGQFGQATSCRRRRSSRC